MSKEHGDADDVALAETPAHLLWNGIVHRVSGRGTHPVPVLIHADRTVQVRPLRLHADTDGARLPERRDGDFEEEVSLVHAVDRPHRPVTERRW